MHLGGAETHPVAGPSPEGQDECKVPGQRLGLTQKQDP